MRSKKARAKKKRAVTNPVKRGRPLLAKAAAGTRRSRAPADAGAEADLRQQFVMLALRIGTDEAERLLARIIEVETHTAETLGR